MKYQVVLVISNGIQFKKALPPMAWLTILKRKFVSL